MIDTALTRLLPLEFYARLRMLAYTVERFSFPLITSIVELKAPQLLSRQNPELFASSQREVLKLLGRDIENIRRGIYPLSVLTPENPGRHLLRLPKLITEGVRAAYRKRDRRAAEFSSEAAEELSDVPEYYQRNFHFQGDGYLSQDSAELYDHQVEVLFHGAANAMRRMILEPLKTKLNNSDGTGLRFLEIGAGCGSATRFVKLAFPKAKIIALDLSEPYLKKAKRDLAHFRNLDFLKGDGESLPFQNEYFDVVYSVFLFHELPRTARVNVLKEAYRVLKPHGLNSMVDSLQIDDTPELNEALRSFPVEFHEPFYTDYIQNPMRDLIAQQGFKVVSEETGFYSKTLLAQKEA